MLLCKNRRVPTSRISTVGFVVPVRYREMPFKSRRARCLQMQISGQDAVTATDSTTSKGRTSHAGEVAHLQIRPRAFLRRLMDLQGLVIFLHTLPASNHRLSFSTRSKPL